MATLVVSGDGGTGTGCCGMTYSIPLSTQWFTGGCFGSAGNSDCLIDLVNCNRLYSLHVEVMVAEAPVEVSS